MRLKYFWRGWYLERSLGLLEQMKHGVSSPEHWEKPAQMEAGQIFPRQDCLQYLFGLVADDDIPAHCCSRGIGVRHLRDQARSIGLIVDSRCHCLAAVRFYRQSSQDQGLLNALAEL